MTSSPRRDTLAIVGGFEKPGDKQPHGTQHSAYQICAALARTQRYRGIDVYRPSGGSNPHDLALPASPPSRVFDKPALRSSAEAYATIYAANGEQTISSPFVLRPGHDWVPVICSVGTAHINGQWLHLFASLAMGAVRPSDGLIFKSSAAAKLFRRIFDEWSERFSYGPALPSQTTVIPNGVDVEINRRSDELRQHARQQLRLADQDLVFLSFSRLSPGTKGGQQALIVRWKDVLLRVPRAVLVLSGAAVDRAFAADLRALARAADVGDRVLVLSDPFEVLGKTRSALMSAADVFVHLSTGVEEASSLVVHEAMAHGLPVITTSWAGMPDVITHDVTGFLVDTRWAPMPLPFAATLFGDAGLTHGLAASKLIATDWPRVVRAAEVLADPERRRTMGAAARRQAESRSLEHVAADYVRFFDATSQVAERCWQGAAPTRPLVDLNLVLASQATRGLEASAQVRLAAPDRAELLLAGLSADARVSVAAVVAAFVGRDLLTLSELSAVVSAVAPPPGGDPESALSTYAAASRLLVRMLNFGALELA